MQHKTIILSQSFCVVIKSFFMQKKCQDFFYHFSLRSSVKRRSRARYSSHWHCSYYEVTPVQFRNANWFHETSIISSLLERWPSPSLFLVIIASEKKFPITERNQFHVDLQTTTKDVSQRFYSVETKTLWIVFKS